MHRCHLPVLCRHPQEGWLHPLWKSHLSCDLRSSVPHREDPPL
ncbi:hypothetical protein EVA_21004 [gut metagenome]|uniref:Uncharacterized protein n=1 Tax=gut metagenome TaxID=749906 RepID=J9BTJ1_9ZZZZ